MQRMRNNNLARVPRKPISANQGLNLATRGIHFVPRLDPVPLHFLPFSFTSPVPKHFSRHIF